MTANRASRLPAGAGRAGSGGPARWRRSLPAVAGLLLLVGIGGALSFSLAFYWVFLRDLPDPRSIADYRPSLASTVLDREGRPIGEFFTERRRLVSFDRVPDHLVHAFVSAEDSTFFEHEGIDYRGILRAAWVNLRAGGEIKQGGSTITQQMVKSLLLSPERSYTRKIREMILARRIEQRFSKSEILYLYLNQIYFGHGAYGVGEAARTYFDKPVEEITVSEAAQLAGLPKAPSRYSPFQNPEQAEQRRRYVLGRMLEDGAIDQATYEEALEARPTFRDGSDDPDFATAAYFTEEVRRYLFDELGGDLVLNGGLQIETTLDLDLQRTAVAAVRQGLQDLDHRNGYRGPLRRVPAEEVAEEVLRVARENGLAPQEDAESPGAEPDAPEADAAETAEAAETPEAPSEEQGTETLDALPEGFAFSPDQPLLGVVTEVDRKAELARVDLAPGLVGEVHLDDVAWARPLDPSTHPRPVRHIDQIFRVGDVARFAPAAPEKPSKPEKKDDEAPPLRLALHQEPQAQGALLSLEVGSGDVVALVGGYDFAESQFNRAIQSRRQPGSAFKPLIYGTALSLTNDEGLPLYTPATIVHDRPTVYVDHRSGFVWKPQNYGRSFYGPITLRTALAKSVNNAAVHLAEEVGVDEVIDFAHRLGIRSPLERSLALALGTSGVSLLELTRSYAVFPAGGRRVVPRFIERVLDRDGNVLLENVPLGDPLAEPDEEGAPQEVAAGEGTESGSEEATTDEASGGAVEDRPDEPLLTPEQAYLMADMLRAVVNEGTGRRARVLGRPVAGKTGTTNDQADAWFVGFSPEIATGVWVGFDESRFLGAGETGSRAALPIWIDFMKAALEGRPRRDFELPSSIVFARIDRQTGLLASRQSKETVFQAFIEGTEPKESAAEARSDSRARQDLREDSLGGDNALLMQLDSF